MPAAPRPAGPFHARLQTHRDKIVEAVELGPRWEEEVLAVISVTDEVERTKGRRRKAQEKLRRLGRAYVDGVYDDNEYRRQKQLLETELESLVVPEVDAAAEAGRLIEKLPELWAGANLVERRKLLLTMLAAVYVDAKEERRIVAIKPKAPFKPVFQVATMKEGSGIVLVTELPPDEEGQAVETPPAPPPGGQGTDGVPCSWWRRGEAPSIPETRLTGLARRGLAGSASVVTNPAFVAV